VLRPGEKEPDLLSLEWTAIVKKLSEAMGSSASVESQAGVGSCFAVKLVASA
jgi:hypothetical protein